MNDLVSNRAKAEGALHTRTRDSEAVHGLRNEIGKGAVFLVQRRFVSLALGCALWSRLCFTFLFEERVGIFHKFSSTGCGIANTKCIGQHFKGRSRNTRRHEDAIWVFFLSVRWKNNMLTIDSCICRSVFFGATVALYFVSRLPNLNSPNCFQHMIVSTRASWFLRVVVSAGHFRVVMFHMVHQGCTVSSGHIPIHRASMR